MAYDGRLMATGRRRDINLVLDGELEKLLREWTAAGISQIVMANGITSLLDEKARDLGTERTAPVDQPTISRYLRHYGIET